MAPRNPEQPPPRPQPQIQLPEQQQLLRPTIPRQFSRLSQASKRSFNSHSSSFEADDERSATSAASRSNYNSDDDEEGEGGYGTQRRRWYSMESSHGGTGRPPYRNARNSGIRGGGQSAGDGEGGEDGARYHGEDTRPTSSKELAGWYTYSFAAETYVVCAIGSFIPMLLESLARENGVLQSDRTTPCRASDDKGSGGGGPPGDDKSNQCVVSVLGLEINTASFAMYTFSVSVLLQALLVVSISCAADHGNYRKKLLLAFAWIGSISVMGYIFVSKEVYLLGALLAIVSNTSFGASFVLLNSFLPLLVRHHPRVEFDGHEDGLVHTPDLDPSPDSQRLSSSSRNEGSEASAAAAADELADEDEHFTDSTVALLRDSAGAATSLDGHVLSRVQTREELTSIELQLSTEISSKGIGIGYCAALFVQCVAIIIVLRMKNSTWSQRVALLFVGTWWAVFTIPAAMWLRPRPGPPLPAVRKGWFAWASYTAYAWRALFRTVSLARRLVDIMLFLGAWFLLSDAVATTSSTAILFGKTQLRMQPWALAMINVISTTAGIIGAFSWSLISRRLGLRPHQTILACIALFELIPLYGLAGYLPFVKNWGVFGLQQPWEMFPLAAVYGFVLGGLSGYCRALYGELIPSGSEAAFYALYAITDKGSSVFGPAIVGAIIDASGEIRPAFWFLAAMVGLPAPLIWFIDVDRGKAEGEKLAEIIEGFKAHGGYPGNRRASTSSSVAESAESRAILAAYDEDDDTERERRQTAR